METHKTSSKKENKEFRRNRNRTETLLGGIICQENCSDVLLVETSLVKTHIVKRRIQSTSMESINEYANDIKCGDPVLEKITVATNMKNSPIRTQISESTEDPNLTSRHLKKDRVKKDPCNVSRYSKAFFKPNTEVISSSVNDTMDQKMFNLIAKPSGHYDIVEKNPNRFNSFLTNTRCDASRKSQYATGINAIEDSVGDYKSSNIRKSTELFTTTSHNDVFVGKVQNLVNFFEAFNTNKKAPGKEGSCASIAKEVSKSLPIDYNREIPNEEKILNCENSSESNQLTSNSTKCVNESLKNEDLNNEIIGEINNEDIILKSIPEKSYKKSSKVDKITPYNSISVSENETGKVMFTREIQLPKLEVVVNKSIENIMNKNGYRSKIIKKNKTIPQSYSGYLTSRVQEKLKKQRIKWKIFGYTICAIIVLFSTNIFQET